MAIIVETYTSTSPTRSDFYDLAIGTYPNVYLTLGDDIQKRNVQKQEEVPDNFKVFTISPKSSTELNQIDGGVPYVKLTIKRYNKESGTFEDTTTVSVLERSILEIPGLFRLITVVQPAE